MKTKYRQAKWNEPLIYEQDNPGKIGHLVPEAASEIQNALLLFSTAVSV